MNQTTRARVQARSNANNRLQAMTIGAAILGVAGTGVFSFAAAMTYTGKTATAAAADQNGQQVTGDQGGNFVDPNAGFVDPNTGQPVSPNAQAPNNNNQGTVSTPQVRRSRHARVSTGSS